MNGRSEGDRDAGKVISSGCHAGSLAPPGCCWTAVFLLFSPFAFLPPLSAIKTFLFFHNPPAAAAPLPSPPIYNSHPDLFTCCSPSSVSSAFLSSAHLTPFSCPLFSGGSDNTLEPSVIFALIELTLEKWEIFTAAHLRLIHKICFACWWPNRLASN